MEGIIIDDKERIYSRMKSVIEGLDGEQNNYNWLITEIDYLPKDFGVNQWLNKPYTWISGEELTKKLNVDDGFWIWGVFSGFDKSISKKEVLKYELPEADGYSGFWQKELTIQHPLASVELVEWDGGLFLAITEDDKIISGLKKAFPSSRDLLEYNLEFGV